MWTCAAFPVFRVLQNCPTAKLDSAETEVWQSSQKPEGLTNLILELISSTYCGNQLSHILYEDLGIQDGNGTTRCSLSGAVHGAERGTYQLRGPHFFHSTMDSTLLCKFSKAWLLPSCYFCLTLTPLLVLWWVQSLYTKHLVSTIPIILKHFILEQHPEHALSGSTNQCLTLHCYRP